MSNKTTSQNWLYTISPKQSIININFKEVWRYRDLLILFVRRDVITLYKQTILGPFWYFIQPLFTSFTFTLIFNFLAKIPTGEGYPSLLFNLAGVSAWNYFSTCLTGTSNTFTANQNIFGKVYFPRVIMPMSKVISNLVKFGIQLMVLCVVYFFFFFTMGDELKAMPSITILLLPFIIMFMAMYGLGFGMIISALTTKYRDLTFLVSFGVQLLMYGSAVMYPMSYFEKELPKYFWVIEYNPLACIIELFRHMVLGIEHFSIFNFLYSGILSVFVFLLGLIVFNKTEKSFIDTV